MSLEEAPAKRPLPNPQWVLASILRGHPGLNAEIQAAYDTLYRTLK